MANPYAVTPQQDITQGLSGISSILEAGRERTVQAAKDKALADKQQTMETEVARVLASRNPAEMAKMSIKYPKLRQGIHDLIGITTDEQKQSASRFMSSALLKPDNAEGEYDRRIAEIEARGGDATETRQSKQDYLNDPKGEMREIETLFAIADPDGYENFKSSRQVPEKADRKILKDAQGRQRYIDNQELVFPSVEGKESETPVPKSLLKGLSPDVAESATEAFNLAGGGKDGVKAFNEAVKIGKRLVNSKAYLKL